AGEPETVQEHHAVNPVGRTVRALDERPGRDQDAGETDRQETGGSLTPRARHFTRSSPSTVIASSPHVLPEILQWGVEVRGHVADGALQRAQPAGASLFRFPDQAGYRFFIPSDHDLLPGAATARSTRAGAPGPPQRSRLTWIFLPANSFRLALH